MWGYGIDDDRDECNAAPGIGGFLHCSCSSCRKEQQEFQSFGREAERQRHLQEVEEEREYDRQRKAKAERRIRDDEKTPVYYKELLRETSKAWSLKFENGAIAWFPKSLCVIDLDKTIITGPYNFMKMKLKEMIVFPTPEVKNPEPKFTFPGDLQPIVIVEEPCPYCGSVTSCDCASPGTMTIRILRPPPAVMAKLQLKKFIAENK